MKPFDEHGICPKCGNADVSTRRKIYKWAHWDNKRLINYEEIRDGQEIIERHCRRCHAEWAELPLDSKEVK